MATKATKLDAQISLEDEILDDPEVLAMLEEHEEHKEAAAEDRKVMKKLKGLFPLERTKGKRIRVGPFIIEGIARAGGGHVEFDSGPSYRLKTSRVEPTEKESKNGDTAI